MKYVIWVLHGFLGNVGDMRLPVDVGWCDTSEVGQESSLRWTHTPGNNKHSVVEARIKLVDVSTAAPHG